MNKNKKKTGEHQLKLNIIRKFNAALNLNHKSLDDFNTKHSTILSHALCWNSHKNINLNKEELNYLIKNSDLNYQPHGDGSTAAMAAIVFNKDEKLNFSKEQFSYMIKKSNPRLVDAGDFNLLMYCLKYKRQAGSDVLKEADINYLIKNSDLSQASMHRSDKLNALIITINTGDEISSLKIIKEMLFRGLEIKDKCYYESTPIIQNKIDKLLEIVKTEQKINLIGRNKTKRKLSKI